MTLLSEMYRKPLVRAVVPDRPALVFHVNHPTVLADACEAEHLLRANGHVKPGMTVLELVQLLLVKPTVTPTPALVVRKRKRKGKS